MVLNVALMGAGRIAKRHCEVLSSEDLSEFAIAGICDPQFDRAESLGKKYGVPYFGSIHDLIDHCPEVDVISVLTESGNHAKHVLEVASYGKHLVVEKPMALSLDDADQMIRACDENDVRLFIVKQNRFNAPVLKAREVMDSGGFGKMVMGTVRVRWCRPQEYYDQDAWRGTWALDGGVLANQASHHIDILEWFMGDVESVFAYSSTALVNIEAEDTAVVVLKFRSGALGVIEATTAVRPENLEGSLSLIGDKGSVEIGGTALNEVRVWKFANSVESEEGIDELSTDPPDVYGFGHAAYYRHVAEALSGRAGQLVDGLAGRKSLELITAIYESIETGKEVRLRFQPRLSRLGTSPGSAERP